jgi:hypothetical protein
MLLNTNSYFTEVETFVKGKADSLSLNGIHIAQKDVTTLGGCSHVEELDFTTIY